MNEIEIKRTPELIGSEIRNLTNQARSMTLWYGIEIGRRLVEAKEMVGHGEWLPYLKEQTEFSQSRANRFMTLFKEYGRCQASLFGAESNYPTLNNLSISNALRLLALPEEEREEFAAEHDVEHISSRELDQLIKEKEAAEKRATAAEDELKQVDEGHALRLAALDEAKQEAEEKAAEATKQKKEAEEKLRCALDELKELQERPIEVAVQVDEEAVERAKAETEAAFKKKIEQSKSKVEKLEKQLADAENKAAERIAEAEALRTKAEAELAATKKQMQMADPDTAVFKTLFEEVQTDFKKLCGALMKIRTADPERGEKFSAAVNDMLNKMGSLLE